MMPAVHTPGGSRPGTRTMVTRRQEELLAYLEQREARGEGSPTYDEIAEALGNTARSSVHRLISALERRGLVRRIPHATRAIEVIKPRNLAAPTGWGGLLGQLLEVIDGYRAGRDQRLEVRSELGDQLVDIVDAARRRHA